MSETAGESKRVIVVAADFAPIRRMVFGSNKIIQVLGQVVLVVSKSKSVSKK